VQVYFFIFNTHIEIAHFMTRSGVVATGVLMARRSYKKKVIKRATITIKIINTIGSRKSKTCKISIIIICYV